MDTLRTYGTWKKPNGSIKVNCRFPESNSGMNWMFACSSNTAFMHTRVWVPPSGGKHQVDIDLQYLLT